MTGQLMAIADVLVSVPGPETWAVSIPSGEANTYALEQDARDVVFEISLGESVSWLWHFEDGRWIPQAEDRPPCWRGTCIKYCGWCGK